MNDEWKIVQGLKRENQNKIEKLKISLNNDV